MGAADKRVTVEKLIAASPKAIFDVLANPSKHPLIDGSGTVRAATGEQTRLALGSTFGMKMRFVLPYPMRNRVVEFEPDRLIAWQTVFGQTWRYELLPVEGKTLVRETFDYSTAKSPKGIEVLRFHRRNRAGMTATLERLATLVEGEPS